MLRGSRTSALILICWFLFPWLAIGSAEVSPLGKPAPSLGELLPSLGEPVPPREGVVLTPTDLASAPGRYDGKQVAVQGEAIGSVMRRGDHVWLNVGDGISAVGVWAPASLRQDIRFTGGYASRGDTLLVRGTFHAACSQHGGDADLHAFAWRVVEKGYRRSHSLPAWRWGLALFLGVGGVFLVVTARRSLRGGSG